jgi:hypothetical protein
MAISPDFLPLLKDTLKILNMSGKAKYKKKVIALRNYL